MRFWEFRKEDKKVSGVCAKDVQSDERKNDDGTQLPPRTL